MAYETPDHNMGNKTIWQCHNPKCNAQYSEYVNGCPKCSTGEPGGSHKVSILDEFHPGYIKLYKPDLPIDSDARPTAPSFDEMVGLIKKMFVDYLEDVIKSPPSEIAKSWERYKVLNHLWRDEEILTVADYEEVLADHRILVKKLDELINGPWPASAKQPSLCDIVKQVESEGLMVRKAGGVWVKASERLPKHPDDPGNHYRLQGRKVNGNFYNDNDGMMFFQVRGSTHEPYTIGSKSFIYLEWLDEGK